MGLISRNILYDPKKPIAACWEALVHLPMITHSNPAVVGIIGGGESALREVTKHNTVKEVVAFEDAHAWLMSGDEPAFDVLIIDAALDSDRFVKSLHGRLAEEGVVAVHINEQANAFASRLDTWQGAGFGSMHVYEEGRDHFLVAFKDYQSRANWHMTAAEIDVQLHRRIRRTTAGDPNLIFDAPTMLRYQVPPKASETQYCHQTAIPWECEEYIGVDPELAQIPESSLEARKSTIGPHAGRGLFATRDISEGTTADLSVGVKAFHVLPSSWSVIENFNHGCNGTYNYGDDDVDLSTEWAVDLDNAPMDLMNRVPVAYSPVYERHLRQLMSIGDVTLRDITQGEEILCNYLLFVGDPDDWKEEVVSLRGQCAGKTKGHITQYEEGRLTE
ncbi:hypothetical protein ACHAXT_006366 [Thalassiosira profunda]